MHLRNLILAAVLLGAVALPGFAQAQSTSDSRVKTLGTLTLGPGEDPKPNPGITDQDIESGSLDANHVAYGEAAANAYKANDFVEARTLWERAAKDGDVDAFYALGVMCERGEGGPKDLEQALGWYYAAQEKGVRQASAKVAAITEQLRNEAAAAEAANKAREQAQ